MTCSPTLIGLGTAALGRPQYINIRQEAPPPADLDAFRQRAAALLEAAYAQGIRYFDTAPNYGLAEELLIEWLQGKEDPDIEVATKWGYTYLADFDPRAAEHERKEHSTAKLNEQWAQSRHLLPQLTTYQIHSATFDTAVLDNEEVLRRLAELKAQHQLHIGITTTGADQVEVLKKALDTGVGGEPLFDVYQVTYNPLEQSLASVAPQLAAANSRIVVKEAMANGRIFPNERYPHYARLYETLQVLADKYGVGVDAVALRFCIDSLPVYRVLSGASQHSHLTDNLQAARFALSLDEVAALQELAADPAAYWQERRALGWN